MKRGLLLLFLLSLFSLPLLAGVQGFLFDPQGNPLPYIDFTIVETQTSGVSDSQGFFSLPLDPGRYTLKVLDYKVTVFFTEKPARIVLPIFGQTVEVRLPALERTILEKEELLTTPGTTIAEILSQRADFHQSGMTGAMSVLSIGGFSKHRVQTLLQGYRITGDRRAGSDLGFLIPSLVHGITVSRGETGTTRGSQAMGGVVNILFPSPGKGEVEFGLTGEENNRRKEAHAFYRHERGFWGIALDDAEKYTTPTGEKEDGFYSRFNILGTQVFSGKDHELFLDYFWGEGRDMGKPSTSSKKTLYPYYRVGFVGLRGVGRGWDFQLGGIYQALKTEKCDETSTMSSYNVHGTGLYYKGNVKGGLELYTRQGLTAEVVLEKEKNKPLDQAKRWEVAPFIIYSRPAGRKGEVNMGGRVQYFQGENKGKKRESTFFSPFLSYSWKGEKGYLSAGISSLYRFPSTEELFYDGITGRGYVYGNPDLSPEKGWQVGVMGERVGKGWSWEGALNVTWVDDYVERIKISNETYTFQNVQSVEIWDFSMGMKKKPFSFGLSWAKGKDRKTGQAIDDIPPWKVTFSFQPEGKRWHPFFQVLLVGEKDDPGPNEKPIPRYAVVHGGVTYTSHPFRLTLKVANATDKAYFPTADEKGVMAPGRSIILTFSYRLSRFSLK